MGDMYFEIILTEEMVKKAFKDEKVDFTEEKLTKLVDILENNEDIKEYLISDLTSYVRIAIEEEWKEKDE